MSDGQLSTTFGLQWLRARKLAAALHDRPHRRALRLGVLPGIDHRPALRDTAFDLIVDVGGNRGQFLLTAASLCPQATIFCYEPLEGPFALLQQVAAAYRGRVRCFQVALADFSDEATFYVSRDDDNSSLLRPAAAQLERSSGSEPSATIRVTVDRLDARSELAAYLPQQSLLKVDVQGMELGVLKGAGRLLGSFAAVYVECSFVELYDGQPLIGEISSYLEAHGHRLVERHNLVLWKGRPMQVDLLFRRTAE
ncbi:MAG TPA: FkbM family methyltransferase [Acidimicrobiales bacterium]